MLYYKMSHVKDSFWLDFINLERIYRKLYYRYSRLALVWPLVKSRFLFSPDKILIRKEFNGIYINNLIPVQAFRNAERYVSSLMDAHGASCTDILLRFQSLGGFQHHICRPP